MLEGLLLHAIIGLIGIAIGVWIGIVLAQKLRQRGFEDAMRRQEAETDALIDGVKHSFTEISAEVLGRSGREHLEIAQRTLQTERRLDVERSSVDRAEIDARIGQILNQMDRMQALVRELEQTRAGQLGEVSARLQEANAKAGKLTEVTEGLRRTLSHTRKRGMWGERLAEDVLQAAGLKQGLSYRRQVTLKDGSRPDFTFDLAGGQQLHMDVKFPFDNFHKSLECDDEAARKALQNAFIRDVRQRLAETAKRGYVDPASNTAEFALLFIPNERVFASMLEWEPGLLDEALRRNLVLVSPTSLIAILSLIRQLSAERKLSEAGHELAQRMTSFLQAWYGYRDEAARVSKQMSNVLKSLQSLDNRQGSELEEAADRLRAVTEANISYGERSRN